MDNSMHTLQSAIKQIFLDYARKNTSSTIYNIQPECAKRVFELLSSQSDPIVSEPPFTFKHSTANIPSATFTFVADTNVK